MEPTDKPQVHHWVRPNNWGLNPPNPPDNSNTARPNAHVTQKGKSKLHEYKNLTARDP